MSMERPVGMSQHVRDVIAVYHRFHPDLPNFIGHNVVMSLGQRPMAEMLLIFGVLQVRKNTESGWIG